MTGQAANAKLMQAFLSDDLIFHPSPEFRNNANVQDARIYLDAEENWLQYWDKEAGNLHWFKKWDRTLEWEQPFAKWFVGGKLNAAYNCIDRHLREGRKNKAAIIFEGEPGDSRVLTYQDLYREVTKFANVLKDLGVQKGDRVSLYMPMIPELPIAMLACARIGAVHSVVFGGFAAEALRDRINDAGSKIVITTDGGYRRGKILPMKKNVDTALEENTTVEKVIVVKRTGAEIDMVAGRDLWYHQLMEDAVIGCPAEAVGAEDMLFILYTSGTTGKPKGVVHSTGGYLVGASSTHRMVFDIKEDDIYWCTADIGWITGHSYVVYGPLANGATTVLFEGAPDYPARDRFWAIIEKYAVTVLYTAPTAIRAFMKWGEQWPAGRDLSSLRLLGSVGEPINPEAWLWYHEQIGRGRCPIVDTWWQTETGHIMISSLPGITAAKPGSASIPLPGLELDVVDPAGRPMPAGQSGFLVIKRPWPGMLGTIYKDAQRYVDQYWGRFENMYFTGDRALKDKDGYFWVLGRVDDVINVSGHRISTMEVESALVDHPAVAEAAVIGKKHEIKGQAISAFVTLRDNYTYTDQLVKELKAHVASKIGALARPDDIFLTAELPKTRSGKIMRRLLRDIADGKTLGDISTLANPETIMQLKEQYAE
ncbi:acetyl-CoA synthetase [Desulfohalotomaculum tongense]|uniref:acetate--CoA ligase n=1 Tax=Desulforadius tongensis TaxID=1216062 RepID=UPI00195624B4|nr:acetate--CoA ligase [Desulforadius tongensis]MBM7854886.1 acetyl-CoA synthetase [Desulforadius tongensis]